MKGRVWAGLLLIVFGVGYLLQLANILDFGQVLSTWWPLILIIIGIVQLVNRTYSSAVTGLLFLMVGILFIINQWIDLNVIPFIWPLVLIVIGLAFLFPKRHKGNPEQYYTQKSHHTDQLIKTFSLFSGADVKSRSPDFKGGMVTTIFGGAEVDLRDASFPNEAKMDLTTLFGGIEVTVPENVHVEISGLPVFGGWDNNTRVHDHDGGVSVLKLNCIAIFGGVDIYN